MEFFASLGQHTDVGLLALRIALGATFIVHGLKKVGMWKMSSSEQMSKGMLTLMRILSIAETTGGIALIIGLFTQLAAIGLAVIMIGALYFKISIWSKKFSEDGGWEIDTLILGATLLLFFAGAGAIGLDRVLFGL